MIIDDIKVGDVFSEWTVIDISNKYESKYVTCMCSCGSVRDIYLYNLTKGLTSKCRQCSSSIHAAKLAEAMTVYKPGHQINDNLTIINRYVVDHRPKVDIKCKCGNVFSMFSGSISSSKNRCLKCDNALGATYKGKPIDYNKACEVLGVSRQRVFQLRDSGHLQDRLDGKEIERGRPKKRFLFRGKRFSKEEIIRHFGISEMYWSKLSKLHLIDDLLSGNRIEVNGLMNISNAAKFLGISYGAAKELKNAGHLDEFVSDHFEKVANSDVPNRSLTFRSVADKWSDFVDSRDLSRDARGRKGHVVIDGLRYSVGDVAGVIGVSYYHVSKWLKDCVFDDVWSALISPSVECDGKLVSLDYFAHINNLRLIDVVDMFLNGEV